MLRTYVELVGVKREENYSGKMHLSSRAVLHRSKRKSTVVDNNSKRIILQHCNLRMKRPTVCVKKKCQKKTT